MKLDNANCPYGCNSQGNILWRGKWIPCRIHGHLAVDGLSDGKLSDGRSLFDVLQIPPDYREDWVTDIDRLFLNEGIQKNCIKDSILQIKDVLSEIYNLIAVENNIFMESIYVYANTALVDLKPYVYTIQRIAFENNLSVIPAITVNDLAGLSALQDFNTIDIQSNENVEYINSKNKLAGQGADWSLRTGLSYTDYLRASICIVFDNNATNLGSLRVLQGFLEERGRRGLPTYVFSTVFFDNVRSGLFYDKQNKRKLTSLTPYLLLGKNQEQKARDEGWLRNKKSLDSMKPTDTSEISGYNAASFQTVRQSEKPTEKFYDY